MNNQNDEFAKFDRVVRQVFSVPHDEIVKREKAYKQKRKRAKQKQANGRASEGKTHDSK